MKDQNPKRLSLKKSFISKLSKSELASIQGGGTGSTVSMCGSKCTGVGSYGVFGCSYNYGTTC